MIGGFDRGALNRAPAGKARALEPRPGSRASEPPRPELQRAGLGAPLRPPQIGRPGGLGWGRKEEAGRRKLGQFLMGRLKLR